MKNIIFLFVICMLTGCVLSSGTNSSFDYNTNILSFSAEGRTILIKVNEYGRMVKAEKKDLSKKMYKEVYLMDGKADTFFAILLEDNSKIRGGNMLNFWKNSHLYNVLSENNYIGEDRNVTTSCVLYDHKKCDLKRYVIIPFSENYVLLMGKAVDLKNTDISCQKWNSTKVLSDEQKTLVEGMITSFDRSFSIIPQGHY